MASGTSLSASTHCFLFPHVPRGSLSIPRHCGEWHTYSFYYRVVKKLFWSLLMFLLINLRMGYLFTQPPSCRLLNVSCIVEADNIKSGDFQDMGLFKSTYCIIWAFADLQIELDLFPVSFADAYLKSSSGEGSRVSLRSHLPPQPFSSFLSCGLTPHARQGWPGWLKPPCCDLENEGHS